MDIVTKERVASIVRQTYGGNATLLEATARSRKYLVPRDWTKANQKVILQITDELGLVAGIALSGHDDECLLLISEEEPVAKRRNPMQEAVREFLVKHLGEDAQGWPKSTGLFNKWLLIREEFEELEAALGVIPTALVHEPDVEYDRRWQLNEQNCDQVATVDAICDLLYVIFNLCEEMHIDAQEFFDIVHAANMTKVPAALSPNKKIMKGSDFVPPETKIAALLAGVRRLQHATRTHERMIDPDLGPAPEDTHLPEWDVLESAELSAAADAAWQDVTNDDPEVR